MLRFTSAGLLILCLSLPAPLQAAEVSGRVTDSHSGEGIRGAVVRALAQDPGHPSAQAVTDRRGRYLLDLWRGRYRIQVEVPDSNYLPRQYGGSGDGEGGDVLHIPTFDSFIVLDLSLRMGGSVAGRVRGQGGVPLAEVTIQAESADHRVSIATGEDGSYLLSRLPPGEFVLSAGTRDQRYVPAYYPAASIREDARPVAVERSRNLAGIDFTLQPAGAIRGRIRALKGMEPLEGIRVVAEKEGASPLSPVATSDAQGRYRLAGLSPGSYLLSAGPPDEGKDRPGRQQPGWLSQFHPRQFHRDSAVALEVEGGLTLSDIDFTLMRECWISGKVVTLGDEEPLEEVQVIPQPVLLRGLAPVRTQTDRSGAFLLQGLPPGDYTLGMLLPDRHRRLIQVYYRDKLSLERADRIELEEGKAVRDIDFNLAAGASLRGRVRIEEPEEEDLEYQWDSSRDVVELTRLDFDPRGSEDRQLKVEEDGSFRVDGTPGGRYSLTPRLSDPNLIALRSPLARVVTVVERDLLEELDFAFRLGGSISGSVESAGEAPGLNQLQIVLINFVENTSSVFDLPSPQYTLAGLSPGRYFLALRSKPDPTHPGRGYGISQVFDSRLVDVVKGAGTSNVDLRVTE